MFCWKPCTYGFGRIFFETKRHLYFFSSCLSAGRLPWYLPVRFYFSPGLASRNGFLYVRFFNTYYTVERIEKCNAQEAQTLKDAVLKDMAWDKKQQDVVYQREAIVSRGAARYYAGLWCKKGLITLHDLTNAPVIRAGRAVHVLRFVADKVNTHEDARHCFNLWIVQGLLTSEGCEDLIELIKYHESVE